MYTAYLGHADVPNMDFIAFSCTFFNIQDWLRHLSLLLRTPPEKLKLKETFGKQVLGVYLKLSLAKKIFPKTPSSLKN